MCADDSDAVVLEGDGWRLTLFHSVCRGADFATSVCYKLEVGEESYEEPFDELLGSDRGDWQSDFGLDSATLLDRLDDWPTTKIPLQLSGVYRDLWISGPDYYGDQPHANRDGSFTARCVIDLDELTVDIEEYNPVRGAPE